MNGYQKISQDTTNAVERGTALAHRTDGHNSQAAGVIPPSAAKFNRGARDLTEIKQATGARREHSRHLSDPGREDCKPQSLNS